MTSAAPAPKANMGQPEPRIDARVKVMGLARYPSDEEVANPAYAVLVTSAIAKGRIAAIDLAEAQAVQGVLTVLTHENTANAVKKVGFFADGGPASETVVPLSGPQIWHDGQIVAVVVANTFEAASDAAYRVRIRYDAEPAAAGFDANGAVIQAAKDASKKHEDPEVGDAETALREAEVAIDASYSTPTQHHNPIELFTTTCVWNGPKLTVFEPSQYVYGLKHGVAAQLGIDPANVHTVSTFIGGAFGSRGSVTQRTALVAIAAKRTGRPFILVSRRDDVLSVAS
jgi:xanthine dehydrogenase YagR molybdenum-binding subunit